MTNAQKTALQDSSTAMDRHEGSDNLQVFLGFIEKFLGGDVDGALEFVHPNVVAHEPESLPFGGEHSGKDRFLVLMQDIQSTIKVEGEPPAVYDAGDAVVMVYNATFTSYTSGASFKTSVAEVYTFTEGLISHVNIFQKDTKTFVETLGFAEAAAPGASQL